MKDGCRDARGEPGVLRICSAKLPRWARWSGLLAAIFIDPGGERPNEAVDVLRDCSGDGTWCSFLLPSACSAIVEDALDARCGVLRKERLLYEDCMSLARYRRQECSGLSSDE